MFENFSKNVCYFIKTNDHCDNKAKFLILMVIMSVTILLG